MNRPISAAAFWQKNNAQRQKKGRKEGEMIIQWKSACLLISSKVKNFSSLIASLGFTKMGNKYCNDRPGMLTCTYFVLNKREITSF